MFLQKQLTATGILPLFVNFLTYYLLSVICLFIILCIHFPVLPRQFWIYSVSGGIAGALGNGLSKSVNQNFQI
jgi:hypothetical protein